MTRKLFLALTLLAALITVPDGQAHAARPIVELRGTGTWTTADTGITFRASTTGQPLSGETTGDLETLDGTMPSPGSCESAVGTFTTMGSNGHTLVLDITGTACGLVAHGAYIGFTGSYHVIEYSGHKGKKAPNGSGHTDLYLAADGTGQWTASGDLR